MPLSRKYFVDFGWSEIGHDNGCFVRYPILCVKGELEFFVLANGHNCYENDMNIQMNGMKGRRLVTFSTCIKENSLAAFFENAIQKRLCSPYRVQKRVCTNGNNILFFFWIVIKHHALIKWKRASKVRLKIKPHGICTAGISL